MFPRGLWIGTMLAAVAAAPAHAQTPAGTTIRNVAYGTYRSNGLVDSVRTPSNMVSLITRGGRTPAVLEFLRHAPGAPGVEWVHVSAVDSTRALPLLPTATFGLGDVVYLRLTDLDQDVNPETRDVVAVTVELDPLGDHELLLLRETGPHTGIFAGAAPSRAAVRAVPGDGRFDARDAAQMTGHYVDFVDPYDTATDVAGFAGEAPRLHLDKSVGRAQAAIGDLVTYSLRVGSPSMDESPEAVPAVDVVVVDELPAGFRYRPGTAQRADAPTSDPAVSGGGRRLTFHVGTLLPGQVALLTYAVEIGVGSPIGEAVNTARARTGLGGLSNEAEATIVVGDDFFRRGFIAGRVTVGSCDSAAADGVPRVRLVLEDGTWTATDAGGRYHFEGVPAGMHVVALDRRSLPDGLVPASCPDTHRFARSRDSQFVSLSPGTWWRADFQLERDPHGKDPREGAIGTSPPTSKSGTDPAAPAEPPLTTEAWLETLGPGDEWLWPAEAYSPPIPGLTVIVKHAADAAPVLSCNGRAVPALNLAATVRNGAGTLAVSTWTGVDLVEGANRLEVQLAAPRGTTALARTVHYAGPPVDVVLLPGGSQLVADGLTPPVVAVRLVDRSGHAARERVVGSFHVDPPYMAMADREARRNNPLATPSAPQYRVGPDGVALVALEPTDRAGEVVLHFPVDGGTREVRAWLEPADRGWMLVGLADGTVGYRTVSNHAEALDSGTGEDDYYTDGRIAFYARGRIKGEWLLTTAFDSDGGRPGPSADLDRIIDPDSYYTLYGDATSQDYDAPTARRLYVRLERRQFYALFGDTDTGLTRTELNRYSRRISGLKSAFRGERLGWTAFAAEAESRFVRREIQGDGTSGPYDLAHGRMVVNSEQVVLETRDRFRSEVVVRSRTLHRHVDYDIDYAEGTIAFREPIFSRDPNLHPNYLVVTFESQDPASDRVEAGGRASLHLADGALEAGATGVYDEDGTGPGRLAGGDVRWKPDPLTTVRGEGAWSDDGDGRDGAAWLAEIERQGGMIDGTAWYRRQAPGFGLEQQNQTEQGLEKYGADVTLHASRTDRATIEAWRQVNLARNSRRDVGEFTLHHDTATLDLRAGLRHAKDRLPGRPDAVSDQLTVGGDVRLFRGRLSLKGDHHQSIGGADDNEDYPTRTILGADWRVRRELSVVLAQEFTNGPGVDTRSTRFGLSTRPWTGGELAGSVGRREGDDGTRLFANLGLHQTWRVSERWFLDAGLDHGRTIGTPDSVRVTPAPPASVGVADFIAASLGAARRGDAWQWNTRAEYLDSWGETRWTFVPSLLVQPRAALGMALGGRLLVTQGQVDRTRGDLRASLAVRPDGSPWTVMNRLDFVHRRETGRGRNAREWRVIDNAHINRRFGSAWQGSVRLGARYVGNTIDGTDLSGLTDLVGIDIRHDLAERLDVGLSGGARHSWTPGQWAWHGGASAGVIPARGLWLQAGYNVTGFDDEDFADAAVTTRGPYLRLSARFDTDALAWLGLGGRSALGTDGVTR